MLLKKMEVLKGESSAQITKLQLAMKNLSSDQQVLKEQHQQEIIQLFS
jgi:vacuolar-type H+-ATPase subunit I/STV1